MAFTKLTYHIVFSTKERRRFILPETMARLTRYIAGILQPHGHPDEALGDAFARFGPAAVEQGADVTEGHPRPA